MIRPAALPIAAAFVATSLLAACSGGSAGASHTSSAASSTGAAPSRTAGSGGRFGGFGAAAQGEIAQITGKTLQVQSTSEQTAVTYSSKTTFTDERATTLAAVKPGECVVATAASTSSGSSGSPGSSTAPRTITATTVRIQSGTCTFGQRPGGGTRPSGRNFPSGGARPSGFPSNLPSGADRARFGATLLGKVTSVSGSTINLSVMGRRGGTSAAPSTGVVHVTSATKYTTTGSATSSALEVGLCAVVNGSTDSTGAVAATRIALSSKVNGSCSTFGGPRG